MIPKTITFADMCVRLNRSQLYVRGIQKRFALPVLEGAAYNAPYVAFLETVVHLRVLGIAEDKMLRLWKIEHKLMQLLHADSTGSPTWFLDACGSKGKRTNRLLLSNFDIGSFLPSGAVQLGLNFATDHPELFSGAEMGEDAILVLRQYLSLHQQIHADLSSELPILRAALRRFRPLGKRQHPKLKG